MTTKRDNAYAELSPWTRYALATGVIYVLLLIAAAFLFPAPPGGTGSAANKPAWVALHRTAVLSQAYVRGLAAVVQLIFIVAIIALILRAQGHMSALVLLAFGGALIHSLILLVTNGATAAAALAAGSGVDAGAIRILGAFADAGLTMEAFAGGLMYGAIGFAILKLMIAPRWLGWFALIALPLCIVDAAAFPGSPVEIVGFIGLLFELAWSLVASITFVAHYAPQRSTARTQAAPV